MGRGASNNDNNSNNGVNGNVDDPQVKDINCKAFWCESGWNCVFDHKEPSSSSSSKPDQNLLML